MIAPPAFHLPGLDVSSASRRPLAATALEVPDLDATEVETVWQRIESGARAWRERPLEDRVRRLAAALAHIASRGPGEWAGALERSTGLSPQGLAAAWDVAFVPHTAASFSDALAAAATDMSAPGEPGRVVHVLSGNVLPPTSTILVRGLLVGAPQWLRPASREPLFAACIAAAWREVAPDLADTFAVLWWPHASALEASVLASARVVTVQGDDASVAAVAARRRELAPAARCVGYGSRWSLALLSRAAQTPEMACRVARDVALFDQQGCLSPQIVLAEDGPALHAWCAELAVQMEALEATLPRGRVSDVAGASLRQWRERQRLGTVLGDVRGWWESDRTSAWAVSLRAACLWEDSPLERHLPVLPFDSEAQIASALGSRLARLQGAAVDLSGWDPARAARLVSALHPTRVALPGELQLAPAGWPQDHHPPLASLIAAH